MKFFFQLLSYIRVKYIAIYLFFIFYYIVSFGAGIGAHYEYAPHLFLLSVFCVLFYKNSRNGIMKVKLLMSLFLFSIIVLFFSVNYLGFSEPLCSYLEYVSYSLLPFVTCFAIFKFASNGKKEFELILLIFIVFFVTAIIRFFHEASVLQELASDFRSNNAFYQVLMPLPLLFMLDKKILRSVVLVAAIIICVLSLKRSAQFAVTIITLIYIYREILVDRKSTFYAILLLLLVVSVLPLYTDLGIIYESIDASTERMGQMSEDGGSGRVEIIDKFFEKDFHDVNLILGNGFMGYNNKYPDVLASHNDIIETYYSYGILGLLVFINFFWGLLQNTINAVKMNNTIALSYLTALVLFILYTFAGGCFSFVNLSLAFFAFIAMSQAKILNSNES